MGKTKAPGPDGFNGAFYQRQYWELVGVDVVEAIKNFFRNGFLLDSVCETYIAFMPKVSTPVEPTETIFAWVLLYNPHKYMFM